MHRLSPALGLLALASCERQQPTIEPTNAATTEQLDAIAANTSVTDGMDQGNAVLAGTPTLGQQMDAKQQPPKKQ